MAASLLTTDTDTVKGRLHALGYTSIPGKQADRLAAYRKLRADMGSRDGTLFDVTAVDGRQPGTEYQD